MTVEEKELALVELIDDLCNPTFSLNSENLTNALNSLVRIYSNDFRHSYSEIFYKLQNIFSEDFEVRTALGENLNSLDTYIQEQVRLHPEDANLHNAVKGFQKFSDHINLEIGRYAFIKQTFESNPAPHTSATESNISLEDLTNLRNQISKQKDDLDKIKPVVTEAKSAVDKVDSKLESNKISSITALTIFSAVTLAFSGGISFSASVFENIGEATPYRLVFIASLLGFIVFNTIFALLYIVAKMTGKPISARCKYLSNEVNKSDSCRSCGDGYCVKQCSTVSLSCKIWHKYSYVFGINIILLAVMYYDYLAWSFLPKRSFLEYSFPEKIMTFLPFIVAVILGVIRLIQKAIQRKRIILSVKCNAVSRCLSSELSSSIFSALLTSFSNKLLGTGKSYDDELSDIIKQPSPDRMKKITAFVEDKLLTTEVLAQTITARQHRRNQKKWKSLCAKIEAIESTTPTETSVQ